MKKSGFIKVAAVILAVSATFLCSFWIAGSVVSGDTPTTQTDIISVVSPTQAAVIDLDGVEVKNFLANYTRGSGESYFGKGDVYKMNDVTLEWQADEQAEYYQVYLSNDIYFGTAEKFLTVSPKYVLKNLIPGGTYYWKVMVTYKNGEQKTSNVYKFSTTGSLRTITLDGVSNSRDLGGLKGLNGKSIGYGLLYRSANLDSITESGKRTAKMLGIKTELDLRGEGLTASPIGKDAKLIKISGAFTVGHNKSIEIADHLDTAEYIGYFCDELRACAEPTNYPMVFHCAIGRDRTGTLAAYLQMLCGVSEDDIYRDFELSFLSVAGSNDSFHGAYDPFNAMMLYIKAQPGDTLADKAEKYALRMGVTQEVVDSIRNILLVG